MGAITLSAYAGALANLLTTELDALTDGSESALGAGEIDNEDGAITHIDVVIDLPSIDPTDTVPSVRLKVYTAVDGTAYEDTPSAVPYVKKMTADSSAKQITIRAIPLSPAKHKFSLTCFTGVNLAATGNTVKYRGYTREVA